MEHNSVQSVRKLLKDAIASNDPKEHENALNAGMDYSINRHMSDELNDEEFLEIANLLNELAEKLGLPPMPR